MRRALFAWLSNADLRAAAGDPDAGEGPVACAARLREVDEVVVLSDKGPDVTARYARWLRDARGVEVVERVVDDASTWDAVHDAATAAVRDAGARRGKRLARVFHLSPGAPTMAAVWVVLARAGFPAELVESSRERGVWTASAPLDTSADGLDELLRRVDERVEERSAERPPEDGGFGDIVHRSAAMRRLVARARRVAVRHVPVLVEGESGTGKELVARAIHRASPRAAGPFVAVNCGAIPEGLVESELFGHERGAFTGAVSARPGHFREAHGGTLFLDEVGELPLGAQVKLLRALQEREVTPVGASRAVPFDARVIAATHRNLQREAAAGRFRADLFYRLAVAVLRVPALRERPGDLTVLAEALLAHVNDEHAADPGYTRKRLTAGGVSVLAAHPWPGNVRELQNTLRRAALWTDGATLGADDVRDALLEDEGAATDLLTRPLGDGFSLPDVMAEVARRYLERALAERDGNLTRAAEALGLASHQTLSNWLRRYGVTPRRRGRG